MSKILSHKPSKQLQTHTLRPFWAGFWFFVDHKRFQTPSKRGVPFHERRPRQWPRALFGWHHWRLHTWRRSAYWAVTLQANGFWRVRRVGLMGSLGICQNHQISSGFIERYYISFDVLRHWGGKGSHVTKPVQNRQSWKRQHSPARSLAPQAASSKHKPYTCLR